MVSNDSDLQFNKVVELGDVLGNHSDIVIVKSSVNNKNMCYYKRQRLYFVYSFVRVTMLNMASGMNEKSLCPR